MFGFAAGSEVQLTLSGNTESCPACGRPSAVMDGSFSIRDGLVEVLSAPQWTRDMLERTRATVQQTVDAIQRDDLAAAWSAIDDLRRDHNGLAEFVRTSVSGQPKKRAVQVLGGIVFALAIISDSGGAVSAISDVIRVSGDAIASIVQVLDESGEPTDLPGQAPTPPAK